MQRRLSDLFALFFDPRIPLLFLFGSVVIAILGNAVYALIVDAFGSTPQVLWSLIIGSALVFGVITLLFRAVLRVWDRRRRAMPDVSVEEQAAPHAGLVMLVSANPHGPEHDVLEWHARGARLRHCWLVVSPETQRRSEELEFQLRERNVRPHVISIASANQARQTQAAVREGLIEAQRLLAGAPVIVDITGGTKPMTAGAVLACVEAGVAIEYLVTVRRPDGTIDPGGRPVVMRVAFDEPAAGGA